MYILISVTVHLILSVAAVHFYTSRLDVEKCQWKQISFFQKRGLLTPGMYWDGRQWRPVMTLPRLSQLYRIEIRRLRRPVPTSISHKRTRSAGESNTPSLDTPRLSECSFHLWVKIQPTKLIRDWELTPGITSPLLDHVTPGLTQSFV